MAAENPIATEVVYEDERVRVWRQLIRSGETLGRHTHERDYVLINVEGEGPIEVPRRLGLPRGFDIVLLLGRSPETRLILPIRREHLTEPGFATSKLLRP